MPLVGGFRYVQSSDPGAVGAGFEWLNTSAGLIYLRNVTNTAWTLVGDTNQPNLGAVPLTGATLVGPLSGATGLAPLASPDLTGSPRVIGKSIATIYDLNNAMKTLRAEFQSSVSSAVASTQTTSATRANIAATKGTISYHNVTSQSFTIPLPQYPDQTTAQSSEVVCSGAFLMSASHSDRGNISSTYVQCSVTLTSGLTYAVNSYNGQSGDSTDVVVGYYIICVR